MTTGSSTGTTTRGRGMDTGETHRLTDEMRLDLPDLRSLCTSDARLLGFR